MPAGLFQGLQLIGNGARAAVEQSIDGLVRKVPDIWWTVEEQWPDAALTHWNYAMVANIVFAPNRPTARRAAAERHRWRRPGPLRDLLLDDHLAHRGDREGAVPRDRRPALRWLWRPRSILPGREGQYIPAPGLFTPWGERGQPVHRACRECHRTDTAVTDTTADTVDEDPVGTAVEPVVETVTPDTEADAVSDQTETTKPPSLRRTTRPPESGRASRTSATTSAVPSRNSPVAGRRRARSRRRVATRANPPRRDPPGPKTRSNSARTVVPNWVATSVSRPISVERGRGPRPSKPTDVLIHLPCTRLGVGVVSNTSSNATLLPQHHGEHRPRLRSPRGSMVPRDYASRID